MILEYKGIIVEEALDDNRILNHLFIKKLHITGNKISKDRWHMYEVLVSKEQIDELSGHVIDDWYIHFWNGRNIIALFSGNKRFEFNYDNKETWKDVLSYGRSIGIKEEQLDFPIAEL